MSRRTQHDKVLETFGWAGADIEVLAEDASFRSYHRVMAGEARAVLMDAPPPQEDVRPFMALSGLLCAWGLSAPRLLAADKAQGFLLLEDLGDDTFNRLFAADPSLETELYEAAVDLLLELHRHSPPRKIAVDETEAHRLAEYDEDALILEASLFAQWYLPLIDPHMDDRAARAAERELVGALAPHLADVTIGPRVLTLRDYHADNLMWLPGRSGIARVGLLDFQDALRGHPAYDLVSLLRDARRDVSTALEEAMIRRYLAGASDMITDESGFRAAYAILGAQRNAKIIGIFSRLWRRDGKPGYLAMIPRVWGLLERSLMHPALTGLQDWFERRVAPDRRAIVPEARR